jgi:hypothetical protein
LILDKLRFGAAWHGEAWRGEAGFGPVWQGKGFINFVKFKSMMFTNKTKQEMTGEKK